MSLTQLFASLAIVMTGALTLRGQLVAELPTGGGPISIYVDSADDISVAGMDFVSANNGLVPVPPGDLSASPAPFSFLLANSPSRVTFGNLGDSVLFRSGSCTTLSVGVVDGADVAWDWGAEPPSAQPIVIKDVTCAAVPEPPAHLPAVLGVLLFVMGSRWRRRA